MRWMIFTCFFVAVTIGLYKWWMWLKGEKSVSEITPEMVGWYFYYMGSWRRIDHVWDKLFLFESDYGPNTWLDRKPKTRKYRVREPLP